MKEKYFALIDDFVVRSATLFSNILLAFAVIIKGDTVRFAWPFILGYSVGKVTPFIINEKAVPNWSCKYKVLALFALAGSFLATVGISLRWEWLTSIGAINLSFGVTGLSNLSDFHHHEASFKHANVFVAILISVTLIALAFLMMKVNIVIAYLVYLFILLVECIGIFKLYANKKVKGKLNLFNTSSRAYQLTIAIFSAVFIISIFKKTGHFSDISWIFIFISIASIMAILKQALSRTFNFFRVWLGAIRNYIIIFSIILAFQQKQPSWIFIVFIEISLAGILAKYTKWVLDKFATIKQFHGVMILISIFLLLLCINRFYLVCTAVILALLNNLTAIINRKIPLTKPGIKPKLKVIGALWCQAVLFTVFQIIAKIKLDNGAALILPYVDHHQDLQYDPEMFIIRIIMAMIFIVSGILIAIHDHRQLSSPK